MPCRGGRMGLLEDHIRPQRRASRRCNYLTSDPSRPRSSTTPISCPARAWSRPWRWRSSATWAHWPMNAGRKITSLVAGMVAGADSIDDMALLRHGAMGTIFDHPYAPSTLGSFLREFTFGHVRQLDAVGSRFLCGLADRTPIVAGIDGTVFVDIDDTIIEVHGHGKQGSGYGYSGVRGLNALITTVSTERAAPVIVGQRLRKGSCGSPRGAARMVSVTLATIGGLRAAASDTAAGVGVGAAPKVLVRVDSAFYGYRAVRAAIRGGADVSVTVRQTETVKAAIAEIDDSAWTPIEYTDAVYDENT